MPSVTAAQTEAWHIALEKIVEPFVFRKYLDFGAINAMRDLHAQIRREVARKDMAEHIKLGPGGIREIEFIAQVFQLIRGGRDPALRVRPTLTVLERLQERGILPESACRELRDAYLFLRKLEHRLQYREDKQTHMLPADAAERAQIAVSMSFPDWERLLARVNAHRAVVSAHFEAIFSAPEEGEHTCDDLWQEALETGEAEQRLAGLGFREAARSRECLHALRHSVRYRQLPARNRERLDAIGPRLIQLAAATAEPDLALARGLDFFEAIAGRGAYLALLQQYPQALRKVVDILVASSWAAEYLTRHPILLDELLDSRLLDAATDGQTFRQELEAQLAVVHGDTERELDVLRELHHAQVFRLLTQDLAGRHSLEQLSDQLSELADIILATTLSRCWEQIAARHRATPAFAIIGYGKLGGKELGYASDLDLVYLCDEHDEHPDAQRHYTRLGQRINTWLSSHTSAGILFETDLRLRPNGESGLLVPTLEAFRAYERDAAWTWEHQALTRARFVAGDPQLGARFEEARREILCRARDPETLKAEILAMRQKMLTHHANRDPDRFDLKNDPGGIIDVEFIVQYLILAHAREHPRLTANLGNIALLGLAAELGLIPESLSAPVRDAYRHYRRLQHQNRLNGSKRTLPRPPLEPEIQNVLALWRNVVLADGDGPAGGRRVP
ncbi:MAG: bifunctional [glutamate--ammonia ligase]-adenylyl-L-tyrosine phosphorylase/[glutamate--ammonia-ligase] adenylyltransferase [Zoogloeaceae bacterium]|nr:bifunctional [glutamate--ammonia ligase]-adenylyl-L-tyrosine phosphorylase/[glutamate--ammonia-ligase] adenylyltransferase [Zoogloeaceae bacterium]